jgi:peptidoglycan glycosyltransferase
MDLLALASAGIGQGQDLASPLQMALVAAAVADGGKIMKPYAVSEVQDYNGTTLQRFGPQEWGSAMKEETSATLTDMMVQVVSKGTGTAARIDGVDVAGKTGTAETGVEGQAHAWFISFAPANDPKIAVAVIVENGGEGGAVAAPIARQVMEEALSQSK